MYNIKNVSALFYTFRTFLALHLLLPLLGLHDQSFFLLDTIFASNVKCRDHDQDEQ